MDRRRVCWFSCGAASAVATHLTIQKHGAANIVPVYCDTSLSEHPDNLRFKQDCARWFGLPVTMIKSSRFNSIDEVFEQLRYMSGIAGARCTVEMKKVPRFEFQRWNDIHIFGYHKGEARRARQLADANPELSFEWPLLEAGLDKEDCKRVLEQAHIELPAMYHLGFSNNNCIGCVKATSPQYWNRIRALFPSTFARRAAQSRAIGCRLTRVKRGGRWARVFLDELAPNNQQVFVEDLSCGPLCLADRTRAV